MLAMSGRASCLLGSVLTVISVCGQSSASEIEYRISQPATGPIDILRSHLLKADVKTPKLHKVEVAVDAYSTHVLHSADDRGGITMGSFLTREEPAILVSVSSKTILYNLPQPMTLFSDVQLLHASCLDLSLAALSRVIDLDTFSAHLSTAIIYKPPFVFYDSTTINASRVEEDDLDRFELENSRTNVFADPKQIPLLPEQETSLVIDSEISGRTIGLTASYQSAESECGKESSESLVSPVVMTQRSFGNAGYRHTRPLYFSNATCAKVSLGILNNAGNPDITNVTMHVVALAPVFATNTSLMSGSYLASEMTNFASGGRYAEVSTNIFLDPSRIYSLNISTSTNSANESMLMSVVVRVALIQSEDGDACKKLNDQFRFQTPGQERWYAKSLNLGAVAGIAVAAVFVSWFFVIGGYCIYHKLKSGSSANQNISDNPGQALDPDFGIAQTSKEEIQAANTPIQYHPPSSLPV